MDMSVSTESKTPFTAQFAELDRLSPASRWQPLRQQGRSRFHELPFPTTKTEDWRFTSVTPLLQQKFALPAARTVDPSALPDLSHPDAIRLTFVNGWFTPSLSRVSDIPSGVLVGNLAAPGPAAESLAR